MFLNDLKLFYIFKKVIKWFKKILKNIPSSLSTGLYNRAYKAACPSKKYYLRIFNLRNYRNFSRLLWITLVCNIPQFVQICSFFARINSFRSPSAAFSTWNSRGMIASNSISSLLSVHGD